MDILWIYGYMDIWIFYGFKILGYYGYDLDMEFNFWMRWIIYWIWIRVAIHPAPLYIDQTFREICKFSIQTLCRNPIFVFKYLN